MSNDLINRQNAIESIWSIFNNTYNDASRFEAEETELARKILVDVQRVIESQPTAYDMDKVLEKLRTELNIADNEKERCARENQLQFDTAKGYANGISVALEIAKSGGIG